MNDNTPTAAPLQMADVQWSENVVVSMELTGAPGIPAPCGHLLQPIAFLASFRRGSLEELTPDWDLEEWKMYVTHPDEGGLGELQLTLLPKHFGQGEGELPLPTGMEQGIPEGLEGMAKMLGIDVSPKAELLGPVPEWVHTAIKSYQPYTDATTPVRTAPTYHG
jgi:hypothetical protein